MYRFLKIIWWGGALGWWLFAGSLSFAATTLILNPAASPDDEMLAPFFGVALLILLFELAVAAVFYFPYHRALDAVSRIAGAVSGSTTGIHMAADPIALHPSQIFRQAIPIGAGIISVLLIAKGYFFAALAMMAVTGLMARRLGDLWQRYGITKRQRVLITIGSIFATPFLIAAQSPEEPQGGQASVEAGTEIEEHGPYSDPDHREDSYRALYNCTAIDGDTLNCSGEEIRLLGIDAPEMPGHCRADRECSPGNPFQSRDTLAFLLNGQIELIDVGRDRYDRTLAAVYVDGFNLSCAQLQRGQAIYRADWDNDSRVYSDCPENTGLVDYSGY